MNINLCNNNDSVGIGDVADRVSMVRDRNIKLAVGNNRGWSLTDNEDNDGKTECDLGLNKLGIGILLDSDSSDDDRGFLIHDPSHLVSRKVITGKSCNIGQLEKECWGFGRAATSKIALVDINIGSLRDSCISQNKSASRSLVTCSGIRGVIFGY